MKYNILLCDPPWYYNNRKHTGTRFGLGVHGHYPVMTTNEICTLPVHKICADNCALFLWTTFPRLDAALEVIDAWGFDYKTIGFLWVKLNPKRVNIYNGKDEEILKYGGTYSYLDWLSFFGIGYYTKSNPEPCLLAVKGKMKPVSNKVSNMVFAPRGKHSTKPTIVRRKIVELFGDLPRVELFARQKAMGWSSWGNEVENDLEL